MMVLFKKLFLIVSVATIAMQSDAMLRLSRALVLATAKRSTMLRSRAIKPAVQRQVICNRAVMPYYTTPQKFVMVRRPDRLLSSFSNAKYKPNNWRTSSNASSIKRAVGTGVPLGAVFATAQAAAFEGDKAKDENSTVQYQAPFEESCKKFYKDLESKPWGEVSKKYIKALQEEEQKLMDEFFAITKLTKDQWDRTLSSSDLSVWFEKCDISDDLLLKKRYQEIPTSLKEELEKFAEICSIDGKKLQFFEDGSQQNMCAIQSSIRVSSQIVSMYDDSRYPHWNWRYPESKIKLLMLHELQHILHNDTYVINLMGKLNVADRARYQNFNTRFSKFTERRADLMAGLVDPIYAHEKSHFFGLFIPLKYRILTWTGYFHYSYPYHPEGNERVAYMNQLHREMTQAIAKK